MLSRRKSILLALVIMLAGVAVMAYPFASNYINQWNSSVVIRNLGEHMKQEGPEDIAEQRRWAEAYNERLSDQVIYSEKTLSAEPVSVDLKPIKESVLEEYQGILDFGDGLMAFIQIPEINVKLPIYHGVEDEVLEKGVGHMPQTPFPIGGMGNHTVLTGHTGLADAELFTDLTELEEGDRFYIHVLDEVLAYQVDQIKVVLPEVAEDLVAVPEKDYCTLVTCTPYGINSHRLLVRGERVLDEPEEERVYFKTDDQSITLPLELGVYLFIMSSLIAGIIVIGLRLDLWIVIWLSNRYAK